MSIEGTPFSDVVPSSRDMLRQVKLVLSEAGSMLVNYQEELKARERELPCQRALVTDPPPRCQCSNNGCNNVRGELSDVVCLLWKIHTVLEETKLVLKD